MFSPSKFRAEKKQSKKIKGIRKKKKSKKMIDDETRTRNYSLSRTEGRESRQSLKIFYKDYDSFSSCDSEPSRSEPLWKPESSEKLDVVSKITQDSSANKKKMSLWDEIMLEYEDKRLELHNLNELEKPFEPPLPVFPKLSAVQYLDKYIFSILCPALEETLHKAKEWECLMIQKCVFSGLDYLAELLWNRNPLHPRRRRRHREIFDIPFVIIWLYYNPRPIYPLSWLWSKEQAITVLQSYIRRYLVCKESECSEMRQFWKALKVERDEKKWQNREKYIEEVEDMFNEILDQLVMDAVFNAEWKVHGCRCIQKPCQCVCKCRKWCKCCKCYKITDFSDNTSEKLTKS